MIINITIECTYFWQVGSVNRATVSSTGVGGKGQGAWLCTQQLRDCGVFGPDGPHRRPRLVQFVGSGDEGDGTRYLCLCARP